MARTGSHILLWATAILIPSAVWAGNVDVNINVVSPPPIKIDQPPTMVYLAEPGIYAAVGIGYDLVSVGGQYYYFHGNKWFWAPGYGGPWVGVKAKALPPGLRKFNIHQIRHFRATEFKIFKATGPKYKGRKMVAVKGPGSKAKKAMKHKTKHRATGKKK